MVGGGGCFSFGGTVQYIEESNIYLCFVVCRLKRGLVTWPNLRVIKRRISYPCSSRTLVPLFSGSGAVKIMDLYEDEPNDDYESYAMRQRMQPHGGQLMMTTQVTTKVPPGFDGKNSWFAFEDAIDDWCDITELEVEKWGPALRNRLEGEASVYRRLLDREQLREPNGRGVEYFKRTLRPHFVKGAQTVFLYRFMRFMKNNRGNGDLMKWMTRFQIDGRRLEESWMDLCPELDLTSPAIVAEVTQRRNAHNNAQAALFAADNNHVVIPWTDDMIQAVHNEAIGLHRQQHRDLFPLSPNLIALIFISTADLSQDQRQSLTSIMTHRNRTMDQYRVGELRETIHWNVLHCEDSSGQSYVESIRIWWKKSLLSARRRRPRWQLWLLGRRRRRWSWRIPGCLRRCILDLGWQWLLMVSKKISRKKNKER